MRRVRLDPRRFPAVVRDFTFFRLGGEALSSAYETIVPIRKRMARKPQDMNGGQDHEQNGQSPSRDLRSNVV